MGERTNTHWSGTGQMRGGRWGVWIFITALRLLGLRLTYLLVIPVALFFTFFSPDGLATIEYHRRILGSPPRWKRRWLLFRHFRSFGIALVDRLAILSGQTRHFSFSFDGEEHLRHAVAEGRGVLVLTAHVGNWEAAGQLLTRLDVPVNVTGFDNESAEVRALLNRHSKAKFRFLPLTGSPTDAINLLTALRRGEVVAMLGDRAYGGQSARVPFLGHTASFPIGPYVLAAAAGAPLVQVFNLREPGGHYRFVGFPPRHLELPARDLREDYLLNCAAEFVRDLENFLQRDPLQWYNFYPFWDPPEQLVRQARPQPNLVAPVDEATHHAG